MRTEKSSAMLHSPHGALEIYEPNSWVGVDIRIEVSCRNGVLSDSNSPIQARLSAGLLALTRAMTCLVDHCNTGSRLILVNIPASTARIPSHHPEEFRIITLPICLCHFPFSYCTLKMGHFVSSSSLAGNFLSEPFCPLAWFRWTKSAR